MTTLAIASIRTDGGTQPRGHINEAVVERYAEAMAAGLWDWSRSASPVVVFRDDDYDYWLADGFHRLAAAKTAGLAEVECDVIPGTLREARWHSFAVNAEHGYARDREDVARILKAIFDDEEWAAIPLREIARHTRIAFETVRRHHEKYVTASDPVGQIAKPAKRKVKRKGKTYEMDTGAIGKQRPPAAGKERDQALQAEAKATGEVIVDFATGKRYDPMTPDERAENERRKLLSMTIIELLEFLANNDVTPERAAREFFGPVAHCVDPALQPAVNWLTAFEKEWHRWAAGYANTTPTPE